MKITVFGDKLFCTAFKLGGIQDIIELDVVEKKEIELKTKEILIQKEGIVIIQDKILMVLSSKLKNTVENSTTPLFVSINLEGKEKSEGSIRSLVKKVLGININ